MKLLKTIILALAFTSYFADAQTLSYEIKSKNKHLGILTVTKNQKGQSLQIEVESKVLLKIFATINLTYRLSSTYQNNQLLFSSVTTYMNGKVHSTTQTEKSDNGYKIIKDGHQSIFVGDIKYSGALLYTEEPTNMDKIYSDFDTFEKQIKKMGDGKYQIIDPHNSHINTYTYKDGILQEAIIEHSIMGFRFTKM